ncbi:MAG: (d)CMP kinase [Phycisphaerales bacterium]|jgi:cytidylate kinase|nr:(d)CMP kinase [Phycisphaerales bacterium]
MSTRAPQVPDWLASAVQVQPIVQRHAPLPPRFIVTIDGPAGTGKSTVARELAQRLGLAFLDTGSMYRAAAVLALEHEVSLDQHDRIAAIVEQADLQFDWSQDPPRLHARSNSGRRDLTNLLRTPDVERLVSPLAGVPDLRQRLVRTQQLIGAQHPRLVTEGRDQGSVVFQDAELKFYLWASPEERARRRADQIRARGQFADEHIIEIEIAARDRSDQTRAVGPLTRPADSIEIDTTGISKDSVVDAMANIAHERMATLANA